MAIIRIRHTSKYTTISNLAIRDKKLSFKARGLHHLLLSYPDDWQVNSNQLADQSDRDGRDAVRGALRELEEHRYLIRQTKQDERGHFFHECLVFEEPQPSKDGTTDDGLTRDGKSVVGKPDVGKPAPLINTDLINTDLRSTDQEEFFKQTQENIHSGGAGGGFWENPMKPEPDEPGGPPLARLSENLNAIDVNFFEIRTGDTGQDLTGSARKMPENNTSAPFMRDCSFSENQPPSRAILEGNPIEHANPLLNTSLCSVLNPGEGECSAPPPKTSKKAKSVYTAGFEDVFWPIVCHKTNKQGALRAWAKTEGVSPDDVRRAYLQQLEHHLTAGNPAQYFRRPESWLNQRGWEDELPDERLAQIRPKTAAELREEEKQRERDAWKAEALRLIREDKEKEAARRASQRAS